MNLKSKLRQNKEVTLGSWITIPNRSIAEIMCNAKFDWLCVDLEHTVTTIEQAGDLIAIIDANNCAPLVRLSSNDPVQIKRVMDAGAHGIIVPMINSKEDVLAAYKAMHYPNKGFRGVGLARAQKYGAGFEDYKKWLNESSVLIAQIEHIDAVNNLEEILTMEELDGYIIGPYDLSASLGVPGDFQHPDFLSAMKKIEDAITKYNKPGGLHIVEPDPEKLKEVIAKKLRFIAYSVDIRMIDVSCRKAIEIL